MRRGKKELYVLTNPIMPGLIKVGCTTTDVEDRVNSLSTAVPADFNIAARCEFPEEIEYKGLLELEKEAHRRLAEFRYAENREFFRTTPEHASDVLQQLQNEAITHIAQGLTPTGKARQVALVEVPREPTQRKKPPEHWHVWQEQNREDERVTVLALFPQTYWTKGGARGRVKRNREKGTYSTYVTCNDNACPDSGKIRPSKTD